MIKKNHFYDNTNMTGQMFFNIFLKKKDLKYDEYNTLGQLYKVFIKKDKNSSISPELNYYFYLYFYKILKKKSKNIIFKNYIKNVNKNILIFLPSYTFKRQFFNNKSLFDDVLVNFKLKGLSVHKNLYKYNYNFNSSFYRKHLIGYNFFILKSNIDKYSNIYKIIDDKEYNSVGKIKMFLEAQFNFDFFLKNEINLFILFNTLLIKFLEIYKVIIYLYLHNLYTY